MKWILSVFAAALPAMAATPSDLETAIQFPVEKFVLENGLIVLLSPDKAIPAVSVQTWYKVGSKDEVPGRTGLAHFFEHMMFKGTARYDKDTWGRFLNSKGAQMNAFTTTDYTGYYINAPAEHLQVLLDIEADRMRNLTLDPNEVASEREVVKEERRMRNEDSVEGGIRERMVGLIFEKLPYKWPVIGSMVDLNAASMGDLRAFYKQFYSPGNAVLVVAGAFDPTEARRWIQTYFGKIPQEKIARPEVTQETVQKTARTAKIAREAQAPTIAISYRLPDQSHPDFYALDLLSIVLGMGDSSRLHKEMVYKSELAVSTRAFSMGQALAGEFGIMAALKPKTDPERVVRAIESEVARLRKAPISQRELDKARNLFMTDYVDGMKKVSGRAQRLASFEISYGDYSRIFSDLKKYNEVTPRDLLRVAKRYLQPQQRNIVIVLPKQPGGSV